MKILSFNVHNKNRKLDQLVSFLQKENPDVLCLQEFPAYKMAWLASLPGYHIHTAKESFVRKSSRKESRHYLLVILSRQEIEEAGAIEHLAHGKESLRHKFGLEEQTARFHFVDITANGERFRIFNCHLECAVSPAERLVQFKTIFNYRREDRANIFCGDFNTFSHPLTGPFVFWLFGYRLRQMFLNEGKMFERFFSEAGLQNPLRGQRTFWYHSLQLDYILLPETLPVRGAKVVERLYGSDHHPLIVEV